jgi:low affinity Fe/Cu permease
MPYEATLSTDPGLLLLVLAVLAVVVLLGRFLLRLAWQLVALTSIAIVAFYFGTVVFPTLLGAA